MKFIRKNGRIIPIRESGDRARSTTLGAVGAVSAIAGGVVVNKGAKSVDQGFRMAGMGFAAATRARAARNPVSYINNKDFARKGVLLARAGGRKLVAGAALLTGGLSAVKLGFGKKKR